MAKLEVYLNEYNVLMDNTTYFPLASGQLRAYAETVPEVREYYEFMPFIFIRDDPDRVLSQYRNPAVAGFSCSMWNINLSLAVAQRVKERFPKCLIVFGGPSVPLDPTDFFIRHSFVDVTVRGEGEHTFVELLIRFLEGRDFTNIPGISYLERRDSPLTPGILFKNVDKQLEENLDNFPSPYLDGLYDYLLPSGINFQVIVETNRGCPFKCSYCFWGGSKRYRLYSLERVKKLADWCGANRIRYVFCADSNFGMLKRDLEIAKYFVGAKAKYGYPEKVRACYGKNAEQTIFQIGKLLHEQDMEKGITLSRQSNDPQTLKNVGRRNIKQPIYDNLQRRYNDEGIPTYTELILGLPGETYQSFLSGMEEILQSGIRNQLMVYVCEVYPNTKLASKEYQERFAISTVRIPLTEIHGSVRSADVPTEYNEIVVSTATMSVEEWKRALVISWVMQLLHGLKLGYFILNYLVQHYQIKYTDFFEYIAKHPTGKILGKTVLRLHILAELISRGFPRGVVVREFGSIYWEPEEAAYLRICQEKDIFYEEIYKLCLEYLGARTNKEELKEIIEWQKAIVPDINDYKDKETFGRKVVIYGRKSGKMPK